ncbi:MAG: ABC transporter substrate-binding protein [Fimbriimonadaceae bacterium]|nr:ABC transporter substrate-binding protein [Alphaproteobacteria bacterium]
MISKILKFTALTISSVALSLASVTSSSAEALKIGFVGGLTGACAKLVESELNGVQLAIKHLNDAGGLLGEPIEIVIRDSKSKPDEGAKMVRELAASENIDVLTGVCSSAVMLAMSAVSGELKIPFYTTVGASQKANIEAFQPYFWQTQANALMEARAAAEYVAANSEWKKIGLMGFDYEWGHTTVTAFSEHLKSLRPDVEMADPLWPKIGEQNMTSYVTAALASEPDVVFAAVFGGGLVNLVKQGKSFGMFERTNLVTLMTVDSMQALGDEMPEKGVAGVARAPFFALTGNEGVEEFIAAYREAHDKYPDDWAVLGYDGIMFLATAVKEAGSTDADAIMKAVVSVSYNGLRGNNMTVRALDHQMSAPVYVGPIARDSNYPFPILSPVQIIGSDATIPSEEYVMNSRANAK